VQSLQSLQYFYNTNISKYHDTIDIVGNADIVHTVHIVDCWLLKQSGTRLSSIEAISKTSINHPMSTMGLRDASASKKLSKTQISSLNSFIICSPATWLQFFLSIYWFLKRLRLFFSFLSSLPPRVALLGSNCSSRRSSASSRSSSRAPRGCACSCSSTPPSLCAAFHCVLTAWPCPGQSCSAQTHQSGPQTFWLRSCWLLWGFWGLSGATW